MSKHRFTLPAAVFLLLIREGHVLLMRRKNTGWCDGDYDLPAGHIDGNETLVSSLKREAKEEIGVNIDAAHAKFVHLAHYIGDKEYLYVTFAVDSWQGEPSINEPEKCDDLR